MPRMISDFNPDTFFVVIALFSFTLLFSIYWFIYSQKDRCIQSGTVFRISKNTFIIFTKYLGFILFGIIPFAAYSFIYGFEEVLFGAGVLPHAYQIKGILLWSILISLPLIPLAYISAGSKLFQDNYPEIRKPNWTKRDLTMYGLAWFAYLVGYEFMFRGVLFLLLSGALGIWKAIAINVSIYALTHIPKGISETIGALVMGTVFCLSAWYTESIIPAVIGHTVMAWSGNYFAIKRNPEMCINKMGKNG